MKIGAHSLNGGSCDPASTTGACTCPSGFGGLKCACKNSDWLIGIYVYCYRPSDKWFSLVLVLPIKFVARLQTPLLRADVDVLLGMAVLIVYAKKAIGWCIFTDWLSHFTIGFVIAARMAPATRVVLAGFVNVMLGGVERIVEFDSSFFSLYVCLLLNYTNETK